ncbi:WD40 repeat-like protein [Polychaeton citri CBS 116435]|uniref:WD40 repeat-like protein n=1 Tax=Polychaeton citri CBS 116435 TaxID=1314669 RepID=A0A9P4PZ00_9PEZI|nr:WD40 repeat-like protein [Polychaeton citri CBS 116435]
MASFDDDADPINGSGSENEDEDMEDVNEEPEQDMDQGDDENDNDDDDDENDNDDDEDDDDAEEGELDSPSRRPSQVQRASSQDRPPNPSVILTSPSPRTAGGSPAGGASARFIPTTRVEALEAQAYDIVPTMAAPQSTSINAIAATPDMRWVFSGGTDGYVRMFNWVETANGKVPLTVAQKHPFVDSVMKAGSLLTYWENEEAIPRTPTRGQAADDAKWLSPVYSLAVQHQAVWLLSGLESGGINLQTCRHQAGTPITTLREHTSAVSVLVLSRDETNLLSGSWDKTIHDWDLNIGRVKRSFRGSGGQISAIETRPLSSIPVPEVTETLPQTSGTFSSNNANKPLPNGATGNEPRESQMDALDEDAPGSPAESLGSLFGEGDGGTITDFGADGEDELSRALAQGLDQQEDGNDDAPGETDTEMTGVGSGGPVQPPETAAGSTDALDATDKQADGQIDGAGDIIRQEAGESSSAPLMNGLPHSDEPLTAPPTDDTEETSAANLPPQSESTFLDAAIDGPIRIWDRRIAYPVATIFPYGGTPPWCTGACWSPDGNFIYAGRRNCTVDEYSIHHLSSKRSEPERVFRFQQGSGPVYAVRPMPNSRHLVCASNDILRLYDLQRDTTSQRQRTAPVPFTIVPGHRGGVISAIHIDQTCRFMLSAAGNRGWEGSGTEVLLGYEIGTQDAAGIWHK